ncbi:MAG: DNA repair protein RecO [Patescibacteria group bacterium]
MNRSCNVKGVILGHKNFAENDKTIFLYTEELGKIKVLAKGSRKMNSKFTGHLETLNFCDAGLYFGPRNIILTEISTIKQFKELYTDLDKLQNALKIAEITNSVIYENQKIDNLHQLLNSTLEQIMISKKPQLAAQSYIIKLLDRSGLIPDFQEVQSNIEKKYLKFFQFLKDKPVYEVERIYLQENEKIQIAKLMDQLLLSFA